MHSLETLKKLNEERAFIASLPWYLRILVEWGVLTIKRRES